MKEKRVFPWIPKVEEHIKLSAGKKLWDHVTLK